jgi:hypothetical protein
MMGPPRLRDQAVGAQGHLQRDAAGSVTDVKNASFRRAPGLEQYRT